MTVLALNGLEETNFGLQAESALDPTLRIGESFS
jgi:hypothetical protein